MQDAPDPRRHPRTVLATDTEWRRIRERAEAAGMPISRFICQRAAGPEGCESRIALIAGASFIEFRQRWR